MEREVYLMPPKMKVDLENKERLLTMEEQREYRSIVGQLNWISNQTRPDISFDVSVRCAQGRKPTMEDANKLNRVVKKTKEREGELKFHKINNLTDSELWCYADASLGNLKDGGSQGGHIVLWRNEEGKMSLLNWQSRRLRRVAVSTLAAEAIALVQAVEDVILLNELIYEVTEVMIKVRCFTDCKSLEKTF